MKGRPKIVVVPRWGGRAKDDWYPWLGERLDLTIAPLEPEPGAPEIEPCIESIRRVMTEPEGTVLVGHSVGCQAALRYVAADRPRLAGLVCVAGWVTIDEPWPSIQPWIETPFDGEAVKEAVGGRFELLISDDDPFTSDHEATARAFEGFGARVTVAPKGRHFNAPVEEAVLERIDALGG